MLADGQLNGKPQRLAPADALLQIVQKGAEAYQQHTGEALDPSLIKNEEPV